MSLCFVDDTRTLPADRAPQLVELGDPADVADAAEAQRRLLLGLTRALALAPVDNLDAFYDVLTDSTGAVAVLNAAAWWRAWPLLLGRVSQCFVDVGEQVSLTWVMCTAGAEAGAEAGTETSTDEAV